MSHDLPSRLFQQWSYKVLNVQARVGGMLSRDGSEEEEEEDTDTLGAEPVTISISQQPHSPFSSSDLDPLSGSPRKRTQTLPTLNCPVPGSGRAGKLEAMNRWSRIQESSEENGEKTLSEDIFKILDLQKPSLFGGTQKDWEDRGMARRGSDITVIYDDISAISSKPSNDPQQKSQSTTPEKKTEASTAVVPSSALQPDSKADQQEDSQGNSEHLSTRSV